jgi:hypothetical protein
MKKEYLIAAVIAVAAIGIYYYMWETKIEKSKKGKMKEVKPSPAKPHNSGYTTVYEQAANSNDQLMES